jgi:hypothetical protein
MKRTRKQLFAMNQYLQRCYSLFHQINPRGIHSHHNEHSLLTSVLDEIIEFSDEEEQSDTLFFIVKHSKKFSDIATQNIELLLGKNHRVFAIISDKPNVFKIKCVSRDKFHEYLNK